MEREDTRTLRDMKCDITPSSPSWRDRSSVLEYSKASNMEHETLKNTRMICMCKLIVPLVYLDFALQKPTYTIASHPLLIRLSHSHLAALRLCNAHERVSDENGESCNELTYKRNRP